MEIKINDLIPVGAKALVGKENGRAFKAKLIEKYGTFDKLEAENTQLNFHFPEQIITINSSFFLAVFAERIRSLGESPFKQKYLFQAGTHITSKINSHIEKAVNATSMEDILDV